MQAKVIRQVCVRQDVLGDRFDAIKFMCQLTATGPIGDRFAPPNLPLSGTNPGPSVSGKSLPLLTITSVGFLAR
jgi:hypothetical protein